MRRHAHSPYTPKEVTMNDELKDNLRVISLVSKRGVGKCYNLSVLSARKKNKTTGQGNLICAFIQQNVQK